ncbi:MAG: efflux RND transporter periplasmic adaptor subunit [Myxococcota bacterium]
MNSLPRIVAPILTLVLGVLVAAGFIFTKPAAPRKSASALPPRVEVITLSAESRRAEIEALGTLVAAREVRLQPEVSGVVRHISDNVVPGGRVRKGELLVRIDARNYRASVEQQKAALARAEFELAVERGRQRVAKREWDLLESSTEGEADATLALRKPHLVKAQAELEAARSALERAQVDLGRTTLRAPFDAFVKEESVDLGQLVQPNASIMTLVGTAAFWVQVSLPLGDLGFLQLPAPDGTGGSRVRVRQSLGGGQNIDVEGRVLRVLGDLDPKGKMAQVLVQVDNPLDLDTTVPLLLGSVVSVRIEGEPLEDVYVLPRLALHEDGKVWLVEGGKLAIREVSVVHRALDEVFVRGGLGQDAVVITSRIPAPVPGMALRIEDGSSKTAEAR